MAEPSRIREVTPALVAGVAAGLVERDDDPGAGLDGSLFLFGEGREAMTVVLTRIHASSAFVPALVLRDRAASRKRPAELPAERWQATELESDAFNQRYLLLSLSGQDPGLLRELFSPALIAWLEREPPPGFAVELNEGFLTVSVPGHAHAAERERLLLLAGEVAQRIEREIGEEGGASLDIFDEADELRDVQRGLDEVGLSEPPESVQGAIARAKKRAGRKPSVVVRAALWGIAGAAVAFALGSLGGMAYGISLAIFIGPFCAWLGWMTGRASYAWGRASVSRVGLEAWTRGYATTRALELEDRWRFHGAYKDLPMPGFADHVLAGAIPGGGDFRGRLLFLGDAAELRATGQEIAYTADRPLAASALLVESDRELQGVPDVELPDEYRIEISGRRILVWRPVQGNLIRTSAGTDRFCERAAEIARQALSGEAGG